MGTDEQRYTFSEFAALSWGLITRDTWAILANGTRQRSRASFRRRLLFILMPSTRAGV
jgi:hypothetical protein